MKFIATGALWPVSCAAIANDEHNCYAMLQRRETESLHQLLERLYAGIEHARSTDDFTMR